MQEYDVDISLGEKMEMLRVKHNLYTDNDETGI
ncbi:BnaC04g19960D [Brassica napus]|uniref:BnaC04g19960D protein n=1 Tax=Brassica napus TaxID=3708 RepID=A0A078HAF2_BRANA|nr:BnaC04g19960D [Brassica napus]